MKKENQILKNTSMLLIFNIAKMLFPFITLPYLTRVFSTETYGVVAYVKTVMSYMQIVVDFGFALSATKDVVNVREDKKKLGYVIGDTLLAKVLLGIASFVLLAILTIALPILRGHRLYTFLSYLVVFESIFLMDFLFRGLEIMHVITIRFIVMKVISTILTFLMVNNDADLLLIPIFDILGSAIAILLVLYELKKLKLSVHISGLKKVWKSIYDSFVYFLSNVASTSFNALSTLIIGIKISATEVAYWSVCMQVVTAVQACYTPISDGIYPEMIKSKDLGLIKKIIKIMLPLIGIGCILIYFCSDIVMIILGGKEYLAAVPIFRLLIPVMFFGFFSILFGWPTLGAIGKTKETTISTICSVMLHIILLLVLIMTNSFNLFNIAIVRSVTEIVFFLIRYIFFRKYMNLFRW
ncbi:MAG: oligosaccharide flippase family protein [Lachnospiraceae bacterium]